MDAEVETEVQMTRRAYLTIRALLDRDEAGDGLATLFMAREAVSSTAIEHPEWDMEELATWAQWETARTTGT